MDDRRVKSNKKCVKLTYEIYNYKNIQIIFEVPTRRCKCPFRNELTIRKKGLKGEKYSKATSYQSEFKFKMNKKFQHLFPLQLVL